MAGRIETTKGNPANWFQKQQKEVNGGGEENANITQERKVEIKRAHIVGGISDQTDYLVAGHIVTREAKSDFETLYKEYVKDPKNPIETKLIGADGQPDPSNENIQLGDGKYSIKIYRSFFTDAWKKLRNKNLCRLVEAGSKVQLFVVQILITKEDGFEAKTDIIGDAKNHSVFFNSQNNIAIMRTKSLIAYMNATDTAYIPIHQGVSKVINDDGSISEGVGLVGLDTIEPKPGSNRQPRVVVLFYDTRNGLTKVKSLKALGVPMAPNHDYTETLMGVNKKELKIEQANIDRFNELKEKGYTLAELKKMGQKVDIRSKYKEANDKAKFREERLTKYDTYKSAFKEMGITPADLDAIRASKGSKGTKAGKNLTDIIKNSQAAMDVWADLQNK